MHERDSRNDPENGPDVGPSPEDAVHNAGHEAGEHDDADQSPFERPIMEYGEKGQGPPTYG